MLLALQGLKPGTLWLAAILFVIALVILLVAVALGLRWYFRERKDKTERALSAPGPRSDDPSAFMTAAMQAVIERLREQEKELASLHQREKERAQETSRLSEAVTHNMPAGLLIVNAAGIVTSANPAAETVLGIHSLTYRRYSELLGAGSALATLLAGCLERGETFRREELCHATPSGEERQLGATISPILSANGKVTGALCLLSDLTELKVLQEQMRIKENLATLGELSAGIAHEFKNALATISGYAQMIRGEARDAEAIENAVKIVEQTRALTHVVTEFLKFARPLELADEQVEVRGLVERVVEEVRQGAPAVEICADGEFADVLGDEGLLRQVLLNLTRNAAEAAAARSAQTGARGTVHLRGALERAGHHEFQRVTVLDNGAGIAAEDLPKIFLPFYTTKAAGTGLGLAIVQKIVLQHGGRVEAHNLPEGGAEFTLWLPLRQPAVRTVDSVAAAF